MKKYQIFIYGLVWLFLLIQIGRTGDDLLFKFVEFAHIGYVSNIYTYVLILSIVMSVGGFVVIWRVRNEESNRIIALRIIMGSLLCGYGSTWMSTILLGGMSRSV